MVHIQKGVCVCIPCLRNLSESTTRFGDLLLAALLDVQLGGVMETVKMSAVVKVMEAVTATN